MIQGLTGLAGPLIGAVIGYCTNYIAVKMLFFPKREVRVLGKRLPFTPGAIPKGKERLARTIGQVVGQTLITQEDITKRLLAEEYVTHFSELIQSHLNESVKEELMKLANLTEQDYVEKRNEIAEVLSEEIAQSVSEMNWSELLVQRGGEIIREKLKGSMLKMFVTDDLIDTFIQPIGKELEHAIAEHALDEIRPRVQDKLAQLDEQPGIVLLERFHVTQLDVEEWTSMLYKQAITVGVEKLLTHLDVASLVENKINDMSIDDLEDLVLHVMKKELRHIVNLGAVIGFLLGLLNLIF